MGLSEIKDYWENSVPMGFIDRKLSYEEKRKFRYGLQDYMIEVFQFSKFKGKMVLDIGCGAGIDSVEFARHGANVFSVDLTRTSVKLTKDLFREAKVEGNVIQASAYQLPFKVDCFDCVYAFGVFHHLPNVNMALSETHRVLRSSGKFMGMIYNGNSLLHAMLLLRALQAHRKDQLLEYTLEQIVPKITERIFGCPYTRLYSKDEARELLSPYFQNVQVYPQYNVVDTENKRKLKFSIENGHTELGWHLVVKGDKRARIDSVRKPLIGFVDISYG